MLKHEEDLQRYCWIFAALFTISIPQQAGNVLGQLTAAPPTCPGDTFTFRCNVTGDMSGITIWRVDLECILTHSTTNAPTPCGSGSPFVAASGTGFGTSATSFISTLSGTAVPALNGTLVECFGPAFSRNVQNMIGNRTLQIIGPPSVPTLSCVDLPGDVSGAVNVTVSWTLSGGDSADFYLISIATNAPQTPYGGILNITTASVTLTAFLTGYGYSVTVRGINCGNQESNQSEPLTIRPQVPATPVSDVCAVYDMVKTTLQTIENTWNELDPVTISEDCPNGRDITASYELTYTTDSGSHIATCVVDETECSNGRCHHELQNNTLDNRCYPPVSQFRGEGVTMSVTARNIVGKSNPAVSRNISGTNVVLAVYINTTKSRGASVECTFHPVYNCTIEYGTDPSYSNLVHGDSSSTMGQIATITLSQELRDDTTYYYILSAESNSLCVRVRGRFRTGCSSIDLTPTDAVTQCADRGFANTLPIPSGVVCYSRTNAGSEAVYICDEGFHQNGAATRVCQSDGVWNGSLHQCLPNLERQGAMESLNISTAVGIAVASTAAVIFIAGFLAGILVYHCISKHQSKGSKSESLPSQQQQQTISSANPLQPEYAEVIKLKPNRAYEDTQTGIEMRSNEAYQQH